MLSLVIPVYKNEENLDRLLRELQTLAVAIPELEVVFVVDGSPDRCAEILTARLPQSGLRARLVELSRNFGSFPAILAGLEQGRGERFAVLAADLQEPPELVARFDHLLASGQADIVFGVRTGRDDAWLAAFTSNLFWRLYRRFVLPEMPPGGVDVFGCTRTVRDRLLEMPEPHTNVIALLLWLGYRREFVPYQRRQRLEGRSSWTLKKKLRYSIDSIFNFTDLPVQVLLGAGAAGTSLSVLGSCIVLWGWWNGQIKVLGYTPVILALMFFGGLLTLGLGIIGQYLWLALRNSRRRPNYIPWRVTGFGEEEK